MYCIKCGVELADSEKICPLCGIKVYNPELEAPTNIEYPYPKFIPVRKQVSRFGLMMLLSAIFAIPILVTFACDFSINKTVTWSMYVIGGVLTAYVITILPTWFKKPNPVVFVPVDFAVLALYLWCINKLSDSDWFWTLALPLCIGVGGLATAIVALKRYLKRGFFFIYGGAAILSGALIMLTEMLIDITLRDTFSFQWSFFPASALALIGLFLLFLGICPPARERLKRKLFI